MCGLVFLPGGFILEYCLEIILLLFTEQKQGERVGGGEGGDVRLRNEGLGYRGWPQSREYSLLCKKKNGVYRN